MTAPHITHLFCRHQSINATFRRWRILRSDGSESVGHDDEVRIDFAAARQQFPDGWETAEPGTCLTVAPPTPRVALPLLRRTLTKDGEWWQGATEFPGRVATVTVEFDADDNATVTVERHP